MAETIKIQLVDETPDKGSESTQTTPTPPSAPNQPDGQPGAPASASPSRPPSAPNQPDGQPASDSPSRPSLQEQIFGSETPRQARQRELDNRKLAVEESRERREQQNPRDTTTDRDHELNAIARREREKDEIFLALMGRERERPERLKDHPELEKPDASAESKRERDKDDIFEALMGRKRNPSSEDGETEDGQPDSASKVFDKLGDVLTKSKQDNARQPSGDDDAPSSGIGHAVGESVGRSLRGFLQRSRFGRGALSLASNLGIGAGRGAAAAAGGAGGAAAGGAAGVGGAAAFAGGPITLAIAGVVAALAGLAIGIKTVLGLYNRQGDELQQFSGAIYGARAEIESERLGSQIERAQRIGGSVAQVEGAQGRFNDAIYDLFTEIFSELNKLAPFAEVGIDIATAQLRMMETVVNLLQAAYEASTGDLVGASVEIKQAFESNRKAVEAIAEVFQEDSQRRGKSPQVEAILNWNPLTGKQGP